MRVSTQPVVAWARRANGFGPFSSAGSGIEWMDVQMFVKMEGSDDMPKIGDEFWVPRYVAPGESTTSEYKGEVVRVQCREVDMTETGCRSRLVVLWIA